jgi:hypothetical protein
LTDVTSHENNSTIDLQSSEALLNLDQPQWSATIIIKTPANGPTKKPERIAKFGSLQEPDQLEPLFPERDNPSSDTRQKRETQFEKPKEIMKGCFRKIASNPFGALATGPMAISSMVSILFAFYSDFAIGAIAGNMARVSSSDNAVLYWA